MQSGRTIHRGNQPNSLPILCGLLLAAAMAIVPKLWLEQDNFVPAHVAGRRSRAAREAYVSANELYDFKMPGFQQWLRENRLLRQPSEGDTDFARRVFLALKPPLRYQDHRQAERITRRA